MTRDNLMKAEFKNAEVRRRAQERLKQCEKYSSTLKSREEADCIRPIQFTSFILL